jgi:hypothetical protein
MNTLVHLWQSLSELFLEWEMFQAKVEKIKTHVLQVYSITFSENRAVHETLWKNMVEPYRPQPNIIRRMRLAWWMTGYKDTLRLYNTYCFSMTTIVKRTRLSVVFVPRLRVLCMIMLLFCTCFRNIQVYPHKESACFIGYFGSRENNTVWMSRFICTFSVSQTV